MKTRQDKKRRPPRRATLHTRSEVREGESGDGYGYAPEDWPTARHAFGEVEEGHTVDEETGKETPGFRVGLHLIGEKKEPLARLVMDVEETSTLVKTLLAMALAVEHLQEFHPSGDRTRCTHKGKEVKAPEWLTLLTEAQGPLAKGIRMGKSILGEMQAALDHLYAIALEHGLLVPDGAVGLMSKAEQDRVQTRVGNLLNTLSEHPKRLLPMLLLMVGTAEALNMDESLH